MADPVAARGSAPLVAHYRLWRSTIRVTVHDAEVATILERLCRQFAVTPAEPHACFDVARNSADQWEVRRGDHAVDTAASALQAAVRLEHQMVRTAVDAEDRFVHFHGAALTRNGRTVLIPGGSGIGKSTLALALACNGFALLGDDVVFVDPDDGCVHPFPRAVHLHDDALPRLRRAGFVDRPELRLHAYVEAQAVPSWHTGAAPPLTNVLLVEWDAAGPVETLPATQAETAVELVRVSHNLKRRPGMGLPVLQLLLARTRNLRILRSEDLRAAAEVIQNFVDRTPVATAGLTR